MAGYNELPSIDAASKKDLYPGCKKKYSKLSVTLTLLRFKAESSLSKKAFTQLLTLFKDILPEDNVLPKSMNEAKKIVCPLELEVQKIHAFVNDCMLYRGDYKDLRSCPICKHARYNRRRAHDKYKMDKEIETRILFKVVWYLPIIPRLKRLFANPREAKRLRWHHDERTADNYMRHTKDGAQWEEIMDRFKYFAKDPRNIWLGECTDGFNPFGDMNTKHNTWPVLLCIYNLPPWLCMKKNTS